MRRAKQVLEEFASSRRGAVSVQNLAEFCSVCLHRLRPAVGLAEIHEDLDAITSVCRVLEPSCDIVKAALDGTHRHGLSFWDAMIWAVARENGIGEIYSEDFQNGRAVEGVTFRNPFVTA